MNYAEGNYWQGNADHPYHLSVGAVLFNEKKEIACLHYKEFNDPTDGKTYADLYTLMRKTLEPNEAPEAALARGMAAELGAVGEVVEFIGSIRGPFFHKGVAVEKTTLYFLVRKLGETTPEDCGAAIEWHTPGFLIQRMERQIFDEPLRGDMDESVVVKRAATYISSYEN